MGEERKGRKKVAGYQGRGTANGNAGNELDWVHGLGGPAGQGRDRSDQGTTPNFSSFHFPFHDHLTGMIRPRSCTRSVPLNQGFHLTVELP